MKSDLKVVSSSLDRLCHISTKSTSVSLIWTPLLVISGMLVVRTMSIFMQIISTVPDHQHGCRRDFHVGGEKNVYFYANNFYCPRPPTWLLCKQPVLLKLRPVFSVITRFGCLQKVSNRNREQQYLVCL